MKFNGSTDLDDFRLQLTNGGLNEAGSAFYATPVNIQSFTTDFTFQLSNPAADGITFTIQNVGPNALGVEGGGLGYAGIPESVAIKFDLYNSAGEGVNSTGLYLDGAIPAVPAMSCLTGTGIDLHRRRLRQYRWRLRRDRPQPDGFTDAVTLAVSSLLVRSKYPLPRVGANTAYVGLHWRNQRPHIQPKAYFLDLSCWTAPTTRLSRWFRSRWPLLSNGGAAMNGARLRLTNGLSTETRSAFFTNPVNIQQFSTSFDFQLTNASADGFTLPSRVKMGPTALGKALGSLGYGSIPRQRRHQV